MILGNYLKYKCDKQGIDLGLMILDTVANVYEMDVLEIKGQSRKTPRPEARKMTYYMLFLCGFEISKIAEMYEISRHTVYTALNDIPDCVQIYREVSYKYNSIIEKITKRIENEIQVDAN